MGLFDAAFSVYDTLTGQTDPTQGQGQQRQVRGKQMEGLDTLGNWAMTGNGPSGAQAMVQRNRAENAATQIGTAKTMGGDPALANRMASEGIARGSAEASFQGAQLKAAEQQSAMDQYIRGLEGARGQDIDVYGTETAARQQNAANKKQFWGDMISYAAGGVGGIF